MGLIEKIRIDIRKAVKNKQRRRGEILRYLISLLQNEEIRLAEKFNEQAALSVFQKEMKRKREALAIFKRVKRKDLVADQKEEIKILSEYLPKMMTRGEIETLVKEIIKKEKTLDFGRIMGKMMATVKGKADGKLVAMVVGEILK